MLAPRMFSVCRRYCPDYDEARDLLQEGFIKVFSHIGQFRGEASFEGWVRRIMVNHALSHLRKVSKDKRIISLEDTEITETHADEVEEAPEHDLSPDEVLEVIQQLPVGYRTVINLYAVENFTHKEIAKQLGVTEGTSKSQLAKARQHLKKILNDIIKK